MARKLENVVGRKFERLTIVAEAPNTNGRRMVWVKCSCGKRHTKPVVLASITKKNGVRSCGCLSGKRRNVPPAIGFTVGNLTVVGEAGRDGHGRRMVFAECCCGKKPDKAYRLEHLTRKIPVRSCGCLPKKLPQKVEGEDHPTVTILKRIQGRQVLCRCKLCGKKFATNLSRVRNGHTKSCGCLPKCEAEDVAGEDHPNITIVDRIVGRKVRCRCKLCGKEFTSNLDKVRSAHTKSCGCLIHKIRRKDPSGEEHNGITIIKPLGLYRGTGAQNVLCRCEHCGREWEACLNNVRRGYTRSCGCRQSRMNDELAAWLAASGYEFEREYRPKDCRNKRPLAFDFLVYVKGRSHFIECHGRQHYLLSDFGSKKANAAYWMFKDILRLDGIKQRWIKAKRHQLLVVPYWEFEQMEELVSAFLTGKKPRFSEIPDAIRKKAGIRARILEIIENKERRSKTAA